MPTITHTLSQAAPAPDFQAARAMIAALPPLPSQLRYLDEYDDTIRTISNPASTPLWSVRSDTKALRIDFTLAHDQSIELLLKHFVAWQLAGGSVGTLRGIYSGLRKILAGQKACWFLAAVERPVSQWSEIWDRDIRTSGDVEAAYAAKALLYFFCDMLLGPWHKGYDGFLRTLRWPKVAKRYQDVISGASILTAHDEALIIERLDVVSHRVAAGENLSDHELLCHCLLCIAYEHGLRPVQIGRIDLTNLRSYQGNDDKPIVHFTAFRAKKQSVRDKVPFIRKIKREWAAPFAEWQRRRAAEQAMSGRLPTSSDKAFPIPIGRISTLIADTVELSTGVRRTATDLRHSAAQRLVDAGASVEEVATFLGHSHWDTSLVYFEASAAQGPLINKALAVSPVTGADARAIRLCSRSV